MRTWTDTGGQLLDRDRATREGHNYTTREHLEAAIDGLEWVPIPADGSVDLAMSPGLAIKALVAEFQLRPFALATNGYLQARCDVEHADAAYSMYGLRCRAKGGHFDLFVVDRGTDLIPVASEFFPTLTKEPAHA